MATRAGEEGRGWVFRSRRHGPDYDTAPQARWNDVVIGVVIAVLAIVRAFAPMRVAWFSIVNIALGVWLVAAPLTLGYERPDATPEAVVNDLVVGAVVIVMASLSAASTYRRREEEPDERAEGTNG